MLWLLYYHKFLSLHSNGLWEPNLAAPLCSLTPTLLPGWRENFEGKVFHHPALPMRDTLVCSSNVSFLSTAAEASAIALWGSPLVCRMLFSPGVLGLVSFRQDVGEGPLVKMTGSLVYIYAPQRGSLYRRDAFMPVLMTVCLLSCQSAQHIPCHHVVHRLVSSKVVHGRGAWGCPPQT